MIIRQWRGRVPHDKADAYAEVMKRLAIPDYSSVDGLLAYYFTRADKPDHTEFLLITHWESIEAIKQFAGDDYNKAKYYDEDKEYLLEFAEFVEHFEVFASSTSTSSD